MKKSILNLGKALNKAEQKTINGGRKFCGNGESCGAGNCCSRNICYPYGTPGHLCDAPSIDDFII